MNQMSSCPECISLAGEWFYRLDPNFLGEMRAWYREDLTSDQVISFPNTLDTAGIGFRNMAFEPGKPARKVKFEGCAWFQRKIVIPQEWSDRSVALYIERCSRSSRVWVDGHFAGLEDSISTPHEYDLTKLLSPGEHILTVEVENAYARSYGAGIFIGRWSSAICDDLHTNWLGMLGRVELISRPAVSLRKCRILSSLAEQSTSFQVDIQNRTGRGISGRVSIEIRDAEGERFRQLSSPFECSGDTVSVHLKTGMEGAAVWNENTGALYRVETTLEVDVDGGRISDRRTDSFGYREFTKKGTQFVLNGDTIFLRGSVEYTGFAETGHPPMEERRLWEKIFRTSKAYGINHYRFHSYCPPEIAFCVADEIGMLLHVEVPVWSEKPGSGEQPELLDFIEREAKKIIAEYYNHPSFVMLGLGNEYQSHFDFLDSIISSLKAFCPDKLYTFTTNFVCDGPTPESDYFISSRTASGSLRIDSASQEARFQGYMDGTDHDYGNCVADVAVPIIAHELGQWTTYPDYSYIEKYRGTIFEPNSVRELAGELSKNGLKEQNAAFQAASGTFSWLLYKEEIETALRTKGMGGFQLLSLADSPGWGEAFTGALDPFWDPKPFLNAKKMKKFCNDVVPLLRMDRFVYSSSDSFTASVQIANYSHQALADATVNWEISNNKFVLAQGAFQPMQIEKGGLNEIGKIITPLKQVISPEQLVIRVGIAGTVYQNEWNIWVSPSDSVADEGDICICHTLDEECQKHLDAGKDVLYFADKKDCHMRYVRFLPVFWSLWWFWWSWRDQKVQPATMSILCDPEHPLYKWFPTDSHSNYQWWDILEKQWSFALPGTGKKPDVLLQMVDDYHINNHLAPIVQAKIGNGRLIACSVDLLSDLEHRPAARQLYYSLLHYMQGQQFQPQYNCTLEQFKQSIQYRDPNPQCR